MDDLPDHRRAIDTHANELRRSAHSFPPNVFMSVDEITVPLEHGLGWTVARHREMQKKQPGSAREQLAA